MRPIGFLASEAQHRRRYATRPSALEEPYDVTPIAGAGVHKDEGAERKFVDQSRRVSIVEDPPRRL